jgi:hypothetical protein
MGARRAASLRRVERLAGLDELASEKQPAAARPASRDATRQQESQQKLSATPELLVQLQRAAQQTLQQAELPRAAAQLQQA